jgi:hypothetical protein
MEYEYEEKITRPMQRWIMWSDASAQWRNTFWLQNGKRSWRVYSIPLRKLIAANE